MSSRSQPVVSVYPPVLSPGCGSGVICPAPQSLAAFCNRCNFNRATRKCGSYRPDDVAAARAEISADVVLTQEGELCLTEAVTIYTGNDLTYTGKW